MSPRAALLHAPLAALLAAILAAAPAAAGGNCSVTSVGFTPLNQLGAGTYHGFQGGLYPGGANQRPTAHNAAGVAIANAIAPLDTLGVPDPSSAVVLISIGMSNTTFEFSHFVPKAMGNPLRNPSLLVIDCAEGGQSADRIVDPAAPDWSFVSSRLRLAHSSPAQVQAVWLKEAIQHPTGSFPASMDTLMWDLGAIVRLIEQKMPNVKLCYMTSRIYAGYATGVSTLNPEPFAYESGFAVKGLIIAQLGGADSLSYTLGHAPWLSWGPYLWADGLTPRSDGLIWPCADFNSDGTHPDDAGREVVADSLMAFFSADETTRPWFLAPGAAGVGSAGAGTGIDLAVAPNPARDGVAIGFTAAAGEPWRIEIVDAAGRHVAEVARGTGSGARETSRWAVRESSGAAARPGVYWARLTIGRRQASRRFTVLESR